NAYVRRALCVVFVLTACGSSSGSGDDQMMMDGHGSDGAGDGSNVMVELPPVNAKADYQLGGAYPPPAGVMVVSRDRLAARVDGLYNICYVNGFQIQPDEESYWM